MPGFETGRGTSIFEVVAGAGGASVVGVLAGGGASVVGLAGGACVVGVVTGGVMLVGVFGGRAPPEVEVGCTCNAVGKTVMTVEDVRSPPAASLIGAA